MTSRELEVFFRSGPGSNLLKAVNRLAAALEGVSEMLPPGVTEADEAEAERTAEEAIEGFEIVSDHVIDTLFEIDVNFKRVWEILTPAARLRARSAVADEIRNATTLKGKGDHGE